MLTGISLLTNGRDFRSSFDMRKQPCGVSKASATVALRIENYVTAKFPTND
ncbi:hypothetical protein SAMN05444682_102197 [Parapedobacter indicus]|uniref:Uncharacterized protein n=1 Tax=Parapedobacter indicus TaxID=1477437 RepID=A0A1I3F787_9SPHI|nr:hypothetical protein CLV26_102197 [Parapedobacter indicus]SFI07096.1 hypothetical protein SAMN05444682_102197 [Parapedobacter indicus]